MSDTLEKALDRVVNSTIESCIRIIQASETVDPADSHAHLKEVIIENVKLLLIDSDDKPIGLPN